MPYGIDYLDGCFVTAVCRAIKVEVPSSLLRVVVCVVRALRLKLLYVSSRFQECALLASSDQSTDRVRWRMHSGSRQGEDRGTVKGCETH